MKLSLQLSPDQFHGLARRLDCEYETVFRRALSLAETVSWELGFEGTKVVFEAPAECVASWSAVWRAERFGAGLHLYWFQGTANLGKRPRECGTRRPLSSRRCRKTFS
jgi:hypothetical protein